MVHEITQTFSSISQSIIEIQNQLSKHESAKNLAVCIGSVQVLEKTKLEQVNSFPLPHFNVLCLVTVLRDLFHV